MSPLKDAQGRVRSICLTAEEVGEAVALWVAAKTPYEAYSYSQSTFGVIANVVEKSKVPE